MNFIFSIYLCCILCTFFAYTRSTSCDFHIDGLVSNRVALKNHIIWSAKTFDVKDCAKICVKRKLCQSFNFDTGTRICELNDAKSNSSEMFRTGTNLLYSEISVWPSQIDPDCFKRPCNDDEVCVPGFLAGVQTGCAYACLKFEATTTPTTQHITTATAELTTTIAQRTTTTSAELTTTTATTEATTTPTTQQITTTPSELTTTIAQQTTATTAEPTITTATTEATTTPTTQHITTATAELTTTIAQRTTTTSAELTTTTATTEATTTPTTQQITTTTAELTTTTAQQTTNTATEPTITTATRATTTPTKQQITTTTAELTTTTAQQTTTTTAESTTTTATRGLRLVDGNTPNEGRLEMLHEQDTTWRSVKLEASRWDEKVTKVVCKQLGYNFGGSYHSMGRPFPSGTNTMYKLKGLDCDGTEDSIFECTIGDVQPQNSNNKVIGITCFVEDVNRLRLVDGIVPNEGRLEMLNEQHTIWRSVELEDNIWNWEVTKVVCKELGYNFGGSYHKKEQPFPPGTNNMYKLNGLDCDGTEDSIFDCTIGEVQRKDGNDKDIGITCFVEDLNKQGFQNLKLVDGGGNNESMTGYIEILYNGTWTRLCDKLHSEAPDVFCKTISNGAWVKKRTDKTNDGWTGAQTWTKHIHCNGETTPHPFFCRNEGWRLKTCTEYGTAECEEK